MREVPAAPTVRRTLAALLAAGANAQVLDFAVPAGVALSVQPIAGKLFAAYQVDGGHIQLAGCQLEDHLVCLAAWSDGTTSQHTAHGEQLPEALLARLGVDALDHRQNADDFSVDDAAWALTAICSLAERSESALRRVTLVQCRHANGKVRFTIGNVSADLPFSGWTSDFTPPPFVCPHTGTATFHVAATDDGRIAAAEQIVACHHTGRRLLKSELSLCAVSGHFVLPQYAVVCPVTKETVEQTRLVECETCRQLVSPHAIEHGQCAACRNLESVEINDSRMATLLAEYPGLRGWRNWHLAETADVLIVEASGIWQGLLAVFDRQTHHCRHLATKTRLANVWKAQSAEAIRDLLAGK